MRKMFLLLLALPVFAIAQEKNIITASRYFPKSDKVVQFEKALAAHAQKYHTGDVHWRVSTIESGPDAGGYSIVEGPTSWESLDKRGDINKAHIDDWNMNVQPLLTDRYSNAYLTFRQDLSTTMLGDYSDKYSVNHMFFKPGYFGDMVNLIKQLKNTWVETEQSIAVYESSSSGEPQFVVVTRYKNGLKDRVAGNRPTFPVTFAKVNGGEAAWSKYLDMYRQVVSNTWSEMMYYDKTLSSK